MDTHQIDLFELNDNDPTRHGNDRVSVVDTLVLLSHNLTLGKEPLYELADWVQSLDLRPLGYSELQKLSDKIGLEIRVAHYPPYASKWNSIEHRLFPHIIRSLKEVILKSHQLVKELIEKTTTETGLRVKANIIDKVYETGRECAENFKETMRIIFDDLLPSWNYRAVPSNI